jgi:hypothetical protein
MPLKMIILSDKIRYQSNWNPDLEKYEEEYVDSLIPYLGEIAKVEEGFTLENLFKIIEKDHSMYSLIFHTALGGHDIWEFIKDIDMQGDKTTDIDYLELAWGCFLSSYKELTSPHGSAFSNWKEINLEDEFEFESDFMGRRIDVEKNKPYDTAIGIGFTHLSTIKHLEIRLNEIVKVIDSKYSTGKDKIIFKGIKEFTIYDLLSSIFREISFYGYPEEKEDVLEEVKKGGQK